MAAALDRLEAVALLQHDRGRLEVGGRDHHVVELEHQTTSERTIAPKKMLCELWTAIPIQALR